MASVTIDLSDNPAKGWDFQSDHFALICPVAGCGKVYVVSLVLDKGNRRCPNCGHSQVKLRALPNGLRLCHVEWE